MARIATDDFSDPNIARTYLTAHFAEAQMVETELETQNFEYVVEVERCMAAAIFWISEYAGAAFYVAAEQAGFCDRALRAGSLRAGLMEKEDQ